MNRTIVLEILVMAGISATVVLGLYFFARVDMNLVATHLAPFK